MNKFNNLSKKGKIVVISVVVFVFLLLGGTLAWLEWSSEINAIVNGRGCAPEIVFKGGSTVNGVGLRPVSSYKNGLRKDINVNLDNLCDNDTATMDLYLKLDVFPTELAEESFVWALYKVNGNSENLINSGNFAGKVQGDTIELTDNTEVVTGNISTYRLYIYIDGSIDNPNSMQNKTFKFNLYGQGRDAIYNEYTMKRVWNTSSTYSFRYSPIKANQVKSITFTKKSEMPIDVPEENTMDVSSVANSGDVVMWWIENDTSTDGTTTLYDVYVGSKSLPVKANTSAYRMFSYLSNCESIDLTNFDTSKVTTMESMFADYSSLSSLDLSSFNTSSVTDMTRMFSNCSSLTTLDLSSFNTTKVTSMAGMFYNCSKLVDLDISSFNTSNVTNMSNMFFNCIDLTTLDVSSFDTSNVTNMSNMFFDCSGLTTLDLSSFDTSNVTNMIQMFYNCSSLTTLDLSSFDTSSVTNMSNMFSSCRGLTTLDLSSFDTIKVTTMGYMFNNCSGLTTLDLSSFDTSKVTNMSWMFGNCSSILTTLDLSSFDTSNVTDMSYMFSSCSRLITLDLSSFDTSNVTNMTQMFYNCRSLTTLNLSSFDFTNVTSSNAGMNGVNSTCNITVKDCTQYKLFTDNWGSKTGLHTINNDNCSV